MAFNFDEYKRATRDFSDAGHDGRLGITANSAGQAAYRVTRAIWRRTLGMRVRDQSDSAVPLFAVPPKLQPEHVARCRMFANRLTMLESLKTGGIWAEIGTWEGEFAGHIKAICKPSELHLIDIDFGRTRSKDFIREGDGVRFHQGDSSTQLNSFADGYFDFIYIDGDHSLLGVAKDVDAAIRKLKPDGLLLFNDYIAFNQVELEPFGTVAVVNSLCCDKGFEVMGFAFHPKMFCDIMLGRSGASSGMAS
jgi:SAM-dependent methyltransferase